MQCAYSRVSSKFVLLRQDSLSIFFKGEVKLHCLFLYDFKLSIQTILEKTLLVVLSNKLFVTHMIVVKIDPIETNVHEGQPWRKKTLHLWLYFFLFCRMYRSHFYSPLMTLPHSLHVFTGKKI